ncbi:MAG: Rpp14/Pop5 family protein [Candidatus Altiarchaeota archaeon]
MTKLLPPTLRERNRYLAFEIISERKFSKEDVTKAIWNSALKFLGELGTGKTSLRLIEWNEEKQHGIIKVNHKSVDEIRAAIALIKEINSIPIIPRVLGVSGTIKKTRERWLS